MESCTRWSNLYYATSKSDNNLLGRDTLTLHIKSVLNILQTVASQGGIRLSLERAIGQGLGDEFLPDPFTNVLVGLLDNGKGNDCTIILATLPYANVVARPMLTVHRSESLGALVAGEDAGNRDLLVESVKNSRHGIEARVLADGIVHADEVGLAENVGDVLNHGGRPVVEDHVGTKRLHKLVVGGGSRGDDSRARGRRKLDGGGADGGCTAPDQDGLAILLRLGGRGQREVEMVLGV